ncbi:per os infectivity factor 1 [Diatraea saccharalis granulovirus]|uniref:Per os infectivity factor 1 n=1 Tax=Diatraea saccharalis granulovirus TaxID=1675862 RepID=A0A0R7EYR1_9BBAC|nr:per os infectivity factor 1 [Diatraea saccharalis granulovirus]AKN80729.1 per os infectivity factor 1 [Diatraea saccharalis granulovirus]
MSFYLLLLSIILFCLVLYHTENLRLMLTADAADIVWYDNSGVPVLNPPREIIINENAQSCHVTPTRCNTNADCQLCSEVLAACQEFHETVILEINDTEKLIVQPGDKYCLALDNRSARSCNPNTGTWVMRHVDNENFALICHCNRPGLVTQLNIYEDCDIPVGCRPNGIIADINTSPLVCSCENGFVADMSETYTPFCRPRVLRDVMLDPQFFHRPPCRDGFLPADHPAFNQEYRRQIGANVCLIDPCSIDPLTGERHSGHAFYESGLVMCQCPIENNLYPIYSSESMLMSNIANFCIKPLTVDRHSVRSDLKIFWGRDSIISDTDIVFQVNRTNVKDPYQILLYSRLTPHPTVNVNTSFILKFQINSALVRSSLHNDRIDVFQTYCHLVMHRTNINACPLPGIGLCRARQTCGNLVCTNHPCIGNIVANSYRNTCFFFRVDRYYTDLDSTVPQVCIWNYPSAYPTNNVPVTFFINALGTVNTDARTFYFTNTSETASNNQHSIIIGILSTYPFYNS